MFYKDWESIYRNIAEEFNFSLEKEKQTVNLLNKLLEKKNLYSIKKLEDLISGKEVIVFGAGPSLESSLVKYKKEFIGKLKIAADGATSALLKNNILPDIIITDLDGKVLDQLDANTKGSIVIIHAHGDNIDDVKNYVPKFKGKIIGTTQIDPKPYNNIHNFGGFTDGDRAIFLADYFHAKKIYLVGFDFDDRIGKYSFPEDKDKQLKLKKLKWCKNLIDLLKEDKQNIQEL